MFKASLVAAFVAVTALAPAYGQDKKAWCTDAHMTQMDTTIAKMTDAGKKAAATKELDLSKAEMKKNNIDACIKHMEAAHIVMGL